MAKIFRTGGTATEAAWLGDARAACLVFGATLLAYLPALGGNFIWNDSDYVTAPALRSLTGLASIWFKPGATEQYYPLLHSAFWLQHRLWGDDPLGYHVVTLLLHGVAVVLFGAILRRLLIPGAWLAALIFALHPVHVESVAWVAEQKNTLSLVFYLAAALVYLRFDETRRTKSYVASSVLFVLSLLCKTVTASLPAALLVVLWWKRGRLEWRRDFRPLLSWLAIGATMGLFSSWVEQHYLGARGQDFDLPFLSRGLVAGRAIWFYLTNLVWPAGLSFVYPRWTPDPGIGWQWLFPLGVIALTVLLWAIRRRTRAPLAAWLFFVGSLFPVLGFVNLYGAFYSFVWDHWQYLPDLGLIALGAAGIAQSWNWAVIRLHGAIPALVAVCSALLGLLTWEHCGIFHDDETLFRATLAHNPDAWMAHFNLGGVMLKTPGREAEAIAEFGAALRLNPNMADAHYNLGTLLAKDPARVTEAIVHFEAALRITPENATVHYNLANALVNVPGRLPDAIDHYRAALRINPDLAEAHYNLGLALLNDPARIPEAIVHFEAALRTRPDFTFAREIVARWRAAQR